MLGMQAGTAALGDRDVDQRHDRPAQIEDTHHVTRAEGKLGDYGPFKNFFDVEHRQAKTLAAAAEDTILRFSRALLERADCFEHFRRVGVGRKRRELEVFSHRDFKQNDEWPEAARPW